jgi:hypothetical protein
MVNSAASIVMLRKVTSPGRSRASASEVFGPSGTDAVLALSSVGGVAGGGRSAAPAGTDDATWLAARNSGAWLCATGDVAGDSASAIRTTVAAIGRETAADRRLVAAELQLTSMCPP